MDLEVVWKVGADISAVFLRYFLDPSSEITEIPKKNQKNHETCSLLTDNAGFWIF